MFTLAEYKAKIEEIKTSASLTNDEKVAALDIIATEIEGAAWQPHCRDEARGIAGAAAAEARRLATSDTDLFAGLNGLLGKGIVKPNA
ncbi:MAG TPA: hypothetical protein VJ302_36420 [Blastocatellia bacterium]|nr:hypothetical protein [Blastocatellia bacterium]